MNLWNMTLWLDLEACCPSFDPSLLGYYPRSSTIDPVLTPHQLEGCVRKSALCDDTKCVTWENVINLPFVYNLKCGGGG